MRPSSLSSAAEQEFPFGWRFVKRVMPDGSEAVEQVALTLEDVLHPKEGDVIPESKPHEADRRYLTSVIESRLPPGALVTSDLIVRWGVEGMGDHSPDVAVFADLSREPDPEMGSLDLQVYGGRCVLVVELVSPSTRNNDVVKKREHYHKLGIPLYAIVDQHSEGGPRFMRPFRRTESHYVEIETDDKERFDVPLLNLMIGLTKNRVACYDLRTYQELGNYAGVVGELAREKEAREKTERQLDEAKEAREQLETELGVQVEARREANRKTAAALAEIDKQRQEADKQRQEADKQRQEADKQRQEADKQRQAREELENQKRLADEQAAKLISELQEKLRLLQGGDAANPTAS